MNKPRNSEDVVAIGNLYLYPTIDEIVLLIFLKTFSPSRILSGNLGFIFFLYIILIPPFGSSKVNKNDVFPDENGP
jgi:hypothetical protein